MNEIKTWIAQLKTAVLLLALMIILTGGLYPVFITGVAQLFFPWRANGSLIYLAEKPIGSLLLGQSFSDRKYFWGRPSATQPFPYNTLSSAGSNLGPSNPKYLSIIQARIKMLEAAHPHSSISIPIDLITASGSGLDPDISPAAAYYQVRRLAKTRGMTEKDLYQLINSKIKRPFLGILGESRVNVLELNLALDKLNFQIHPVALDESP